MSIEKQPEILMFDIKWEKVEAINLLLFFNTLPNVFKIGDLFEIKHENANYEYMLKGIIFFCQNHYYSYFRVQAGEKFIWVRFDD